VFIDPFAAHIHFWTGRNDERKFYSLRPRPLGLKQDTSNPRQNQFADGMASRSRLLFKLPVQRRRNVNRGTNTFLLHDPIIS
jgi:hypothetical protein